MKPAFFGCNDNARDGISIEFTRSRNELYISGWYDTFVGITPETVTLRKFFDRCGITKKDCEKAWREDGNKGIY
jgi:hypothetical protein